ncbi:MAG: hypothetical protein MRJ92_01400 [Nitrospira sp.]|nr:hypothetical protein [Nitrospira sp.]
MIASTTAGRKLDPDNMSVCYALEARDGTRGVLSMPTTYANPDVSEFLTRVPIHEELA